MQTLFDDFQEAASAASFALRKSAVTGCGYVLELGEKACNKTDAQKEWRYRQTPAKFGPIRSGAALAGLRRGHPACGRPPCTKTNGAELDAAPLKQADLRLRRQRGGRHTRRDMPPDDANAAAAPSWSCFLSLSTVPVAQTRFHALSGRSKMHHCILCLVCGGRSRKGKRRSTP